MGDVGQFESLQLLFEVFEIANKTPALIDLYLANKLKEICERLARLSPNKQDEIFER